MRDRERDPEARIIYILLIVVTAPFIAAPLVRRESIGAGTSVCMLLAALGIVGLVADWRKRTRLPRACVWERERERARRDA
jgi:hypothetical protein